MDSDWNPRRAAARSGFAVLLLALTAAPAHAQDSDWTIGEFLRPRAQIPDLFGVRDRYRLIDDDDAPGGVPKPPQALGDEDEPAPYPVPRYRLELSYRISWVISSKLKIGPNTNAHTIRPRRDLHMPGTAHHGLRGLFEVKFHEDFLVGGYYTHVFVHGPKRDIHRTGVSLGSDRIPRTARTQTSIDISMAEVFLRYVGRDDGRVKFSFGIGLAWTAFRIQIDADDPTAGSINAEGHVDGYFAPTIGYMIQFEMWPWLHLYLESMNALINPTRFPSYASEFRLGFRIPIGNFELMCALTSFSGQIEDTKDLWGGSHTKTYRWRQASWWVAGAEFGLSWRF